MKQYEYGLLKGRGACYSIKILRSFQKCSKGRSYIVENAQDGQLHFFTEKAYYIPVVGNIYYCGIGVSSTMMADERRLEHENTMAYAFEFFGSLGEVFSPRYSRLPQYNISVKRFHYKPSAGSYVRVILAYFRSFEWSISPKKLDIRHFLFKVLRRLPHKKPIQW